MTTAELIKQLHDQDPTGELQTVVGNTPIYFAENVEAYWDGCLEMLVQDQDKASYNIVGYKVTRVGRKVRIHTMDLDDVMLNNPDIPVDLGEVNGRHLSIWEENVRKTREEMKEIVAQVDAEEETP